ncbi:hypothetical protein NPIL_299121 [Nephila pilipes]|uniref:Uncharacterized protein n=1 Tax=Nephila pilipes TaxID=299642 RepID=A0A8X6MNN3_NEPPI|nr:hypothetical protein NPIL_299121 [Nephila pilipes]
MNNRSTRRAEDLCLITLSLGSMSEGALDVSTQEETAHLKHSSPGSLKLSASKDENEARNGRELKLAKKEIDEIKR